MQQVKIILLFFILIPFLSGCRNVHKDKVINTIQNNKRLIIYCENAVAPPIYELKKQFEKEFNCEVIIQNDCAQNLIGLINYSNKGDLFIPSSRHSFGVLREKTEEEILDSVFLGYNSVVFMVKKGNPKGFNGDLSLLASNELSLIIANPETSSLGYETRKVLIAGRIYNKVINNVISLSTDSKGLIKSLINNQADLIINFASTIHINGNINDVEIIPLESKYQKSLEVYAGILSTTNNRDLAESFMAYVNTPESKSVLMRYGFSKRKTLIF